MQIGRRNINGIIMRLLEFVRIRKGMILWGLEGRECRPAGTIIANACECVIDRLSKLVIIFSHIIIFLF